MVFENCEIKAGGLDWTRPQVRVLRGPSPSQVRVQRGPSPSRVRVHKKVDSSPDSSTPTLLVCTVQQVFHGSLNLLIWSGGAVVVAVVEHEPLNVDWRRSRSRSG